MGQDKFQVYDGGEEGKQGTITREHFKEAIFEAIKDAQSKPNTQGELPVRELVRLGETADSTDVYSWKCLNSCGCPLTQVGAVDIVDGPVESNLPVQHIFNAFTCTFDELAKASGSIEGNACDSGYTLTVVD